MEIKTKKITNKISIAEQETRIYRDNDGWTMDSTVPKDLNAALRKGWTPVEQTVYDDGTVCGMILKAIPSAVTIRKNAARSISEEQKRKATAALAKYRAEK